ncbi:ABC transporter substrate-binding protein [Phytoactinopolyspora endophytica]|uniref:ABC transporter substrate-binding protein n=1 Tax=Phytoactinopolyspora endophytica TaxID=1642495 RepID=UPI00101DB8FB|nr:ABC transporter substrate-binding protein [Phytoactinopolyspora endophytica]
MTTATTTIRFAGAAQGFNWLPVFVAEDRGLFAAHGLTIEFHRLGSVEKATAAVREGAVDLAITPPEGAIVDHLGGGNLRVIGSNAERLPMSMVARPGLSELAELRGARIGTSSLTEGTSIYTRRLLSRTGIEPDAYTFVLAGIHTARWTALQNGEIDAAPQPVPWSLLAQREGYGVLGDISEVIPEIVFAALVARADWLDAHDDAAGRLVRALAEAHDIVNDPAADATTTPIYQRITTPDEPDLAAAGFTITRDLGMWPSGLRVSEAALATSIDLMVEAGLISEESRGDAAGVVDARFTDPFTD